MIGHSVQVMGDRDRLSKFIFVVVFVFSLFAITYTLLPSLAYGQEVSLSISPPLTEIAIQPGRSFTQTITIKNNGVPVTLAPKIVPFVPLDGLGHAELIEDKISVDAFNSWFTFDPSPVSIAETASHDFQIKISPPIGAELRDYYFTFVAEVVPGDILGINSSQAQARIGANILLTASKDGNPHKNASIVEFSAPTFLDSFTGLTYKVILGNSGASYYKPVGKITVEQIFGSTHILTLTPLNVLVGGKREISCLQGEALEACRVPGKFLIGIYRANLSFTIDGEGPSIEKQVYTVVFPFSILLGLITIIITYTMIRKLKP